MGVESRIGDKSPWINKTTGFSLGAISFSGFGDEIGHVFRN